ncbi:MAG TPA: porin [Verrucomicrobiota bacterium]|nr:porin [Verrucomicrobiota bacterium]
MAAVCLRRSRHVGAGTAPLFPRPCLILGLCVALASEAERRDVLGAEDTPSPPLPGAAYSSEETGPGRLKEQTRVTVETNALASAGATGTNAPPRQFDWDLSWGGWDGLHFSLTRKTVFGWQRAVSAEVPVLRLEETRLDGKVGGKLALNAAAYVTDDDWSGFDNGAEVRRARLYAKGDCLLLLPVSYELEVGYIPDQFYIEDSHLEFHNLGFLGSLKAGQFQVPMSLVNYGSSRDTMFMESATVVHALAPGVNAGYQVGGPVLDRRMTWAFGLFTDSVGDDFGDATKGFGRAVARVTGLPFHVRDADSPHSQRLLHLGLSGTALLAGERTVRYRSRPESHLAPYVVDTGEIAADGAVASGVEAAWVQGPLCVQGEYLHSWVQGEAGPAIDFGGFYAQASWLLTGESRPYDRLNGTFARLIPKRNFNFGKGGWGAWEIAGRYSMVDLNSGDVDGGRTSMVMLGVNWYLHPHVKWRFNCGLGRVSGRAPDGHLHVFQTSAEFDF